MDSSPTCSSSLVNHGVPEVEKSKTFIETISRSDKIDLSLGDEEDIPSGDVEDLSMGDKEDISSGDKEDVSIEDIEEISKGEEKDVSKGNKGPQTEEYDVHSIVIDPLPVCKDEPISSDEDAGTVEGENVVSVSINKRQTLGERIAGIVVLDKLEPADTVDTLNMMPGGNLQPVVQVMRLRLSEEQASYASTLSHGMKTRKSNSRKLTYKIRCGKTYADMVTDDEDSYLDNGQGVLSETDEPIKKGDRSAKYACTVCNASFKLKKHFTSHVRTHSKKEKALKTTAKAEKIHECDICGKTFQKNCWMLKHKETHLTPEERDEIRSKKVRVKKENNEFHLCELCGLSFQSSHRLAAHRKIHTEDGLFLCITCDMVFYEYEDLVSHKVIHKPEQKKTICDICGKSFKDPKYMKSHKRVHTGEKPYKCEVCGKGFADRRNLKKHRMVHTGEKKCFCEFCGKGFSRNMSLTSHKRIHTGEKPYMCDQCPKAYARSGELKSHIDRVHLGIKRPKPTEKIHECDQCDAKFARKQTLVCHLENHRTTYDFICEDCGKAFKGKKGLQKHKLVHNIVGKPHRCGVCGLCFARKSYLTRHSIVHSTERPWECATCGKTYVRRMDMILHQRNHTGHKPYKCHLCDFVTARPYHLTRHKRLHLGRKDFVCDDCGEEFYRRFDLNMHKKKFHSGVYRARRKGYGKIRVLRIDDPNLVFPDGDERVSLAKIAEQESVSIAKIAEQEIKKQIDADIKSEIISNMQSTQNKAPVGPNHMPDLPMRLPVQQNLDQLMRLPVQKSPDQQMRLSLQQSPDHQMRLPVQQCQASEVQTQRHMAPHHLSGAPHFLSVQPNQAFEQNRFTPLVTDPNFVSVHVVNPNFFHM